MNYYKMILFLIIATALSILCCVCVVVDAAENVSANITPHQTQEDIVRIAQGDTVYINGTYDISGVLGWDNDEGNYNYISYCGGYDCYESSTLYLLQLPPRSRVAGSESVYRYRIDPAIFANRTGDWYQYDKSDEGSHANTLAFTVAAMYANQSLVMPNGTIINQTTIAWGDTAGLKLDKEYILPEKPVSDYLIARGDFFTLSDNVTEKVWIFGRNTPLYDYETYDGDITYNSSVTEAMEPGSYYLMKHYAGKNGDFDVRFYDEHIQWKHGWSGIVNVDVPGVQPLMVADMVADSINRTDDTYTILHLEVQEPSVTIEGFSEVPLTPQYTGYEEYRIKDGFVSLFDVRGYSNLNEGTNITVTLDPTRHTPKDIDHYMFNTTVKRAIDGNMGYYQVYVPIVWDDMTIGMHTLVVSSILGAKSYHDFPISVLPEDSFKPNTTVKYALDRNPWIPTPTPEVQVTIVEKKIVVTQTILVPVTPSTEVVKAEQKNIILEYLTYGVIGILSLAILVGIVLYALSVFRRAKL